MFDKNKIKMRKEVEEQKSLVYAEASQKVIKKNNGNKKLHDCENIAI